MVNVKPKANNSNLKTEKFYTSHLCNFRFSISKRQIPATMHVVAGGIKLNNFENEEEPRFLFWQMISHLTRAQFMVLHTTKKCARLLLWKGFKKLHISYCPHPQGILTQLLDILTTLQPLFQMMRACLRWRFVTVYSSRFNWYWNISGAFWVDRICPTYCLASGHAG